MTSWGTPFSDAGRAYGSSGTMPTPPCMAGNRRCNNQQRQHMDLLANNTGSAPRLKPSYSALSPSYKREQERTCQVWWIRPLHVLCAQHQQRRLRCPEPKQRQHAGAPLLVPRRASFEHYIACIPTHRPLLQSDETLPRTGMLLMQFRLFQDDCSGPERRQGFEGWPPLVDRDDVPGAGLDCHGAGGPGTAAGRIWCGGPWPSQSRRGAGLIPSVSDQPSCQQSLANAGGQVPLCSWLARASRPTRRSAAPH